MKKERPDEAHEPDAHRGGTTKVVEFAIAEHRFGLPLEFVGEVVDLGSGAVDGDRWTGGGRELRVVSAAEALGLDDAETSAERGLVLDAAGAQILLVVERVLGVVELETSMLLEPPTFFGTGTAAVVAGLIREGDRMIVLLRPDGLPGVTARAARGG